MVRKRAAHGCGNSDRFRVGQMLVWRRHKGSRTTVKRMIDKHSGHVRCAAPEFGGFLGLGTDHHPLPWSRLNCDTQLDGCVLPLGKSLLERAAALPVEPRTGLPGRVRPQGLRPLWRGLVLTPRASTLQSAHPAQAGFVTFPHRLDPRHSRAGALLTEQLDVQTPPFALRCRRPAPCSIAALRYLRTNGVGGSFVC